MLHSRIFLTVATLLVLLLRNKSTGEAFQPEFAGPIVNLSVPVGRDATFRCLVHHLGGYRVGWVKADTKAIQAIHEHVITHNPRVSVSHGGHAAWNLHIRDVQEDDRGFYMCQVNTDPMKSQVGHLDVVVPPDFISEETSGDVMIPEGGTVRLICRARGHPMPHVQWRREDGQDLVIREPGGHRTRAQIFQGEILKLVKITRSEMGAYMCIASNGVPPTISKRIMVSVHFHPVIQVPNQLVGAPPGTNVSLECYVEAFPVPINYWVKDAGEMVISDDKHDVRVSAKSMFEVKMSLTVRNLQPDDAGSYKCVAKNSVGEVESSIRLYMIPGPTKPPRQEDVDDLSSNNGINQEKSDPGSHHHSHHHQHSPVRENQESTGATITGTHPGHSGNRVPADPPPSKDTLENGDGSSAAIFISQTATSVHLLLCLLLAGAKLNTV